MEKVPGMVSGIDEFARVQKWITPIDAKCRNGQNRGANSTSDGPASGARTAGHNMQVSDMWTVASQLFMDLTQAQLLLEDQDWRSVTWTETGMHASLSVQGFESTVIQRRRKASRLLRRTHPTRRGLYMVVCRCQANSQLSARDQ